MHVCVQLHVSYIHLHTLVMMVMMCAYVMHEYAAFLFLSHSSTQHRTTIDEIAHLGSTCPRQPEHGIKDSEIKLHI